MEVKQYSAPTHGKSMKIIDRILLEKVTKKQRHEMKAYALGGGKVCIGIVAHLENNSKGLYLFPWWAVKNSQYEGLAVWDGQMYAGLRDTLKRNTIWDIQMYAGLKNILKRSTILW